MSSLHDEAVEDLMLQSARPYGREYAGASGIRLLAKRLGIPIENAPSHFAANAEGLVMTEGSRATIYLDSDTSAQPSRTTFTIAHELAHVLYNRSVGKAPSSQGDYWRLERICNRVAARLLLPDASWDDARSDGSPKSLLIAATRLASRYGVSRDVAIRRAIELFPNVDAAGAAEVRNHRTKGLIGRISWVEPDSWMGLRPGTHLVRSHPLWHLLVGGEGAVKWIASGNLDGTELARIRGARRVHFIAISRDNAGYETGESSTWLDTSATNHPLR